MGLCTSRPFRTDDMENIQHLLIFFCFDKYIMWIRIFFCNLLKTRINYCFQSIFSRFVKCDKRLNSFGLESIFIFEGRIEKLGFLGKKLYMDIKVLKFGFRLKLNYPMLFSKYWGI